MKYLLNTKSLLGGNPIQFGFDPLPPLSECKSANEAFTRPGYRRVIRIVPSEGEVRASLEDDLHGMSVVLKHHKGIITDILPEMTRAPWSPCRGAIQKLRDTFLGASLSAVTARNARQANCTHLHDLAIFAATYAGESEGCTYAIAVSDPDAGKRILTLCRNGALIHEWVETNGLFTKPEALAGLTVLTLRSWISSLSGIDQEAARLLQWAGLVSHGRTMDKRSRRAALEQGANCYTMQPERVGSAKMNSPMFDFSAGQIRMLETVGDDTLEPERKH